MQLVGPDDRILAQVDSYPGGGTRPTSLWQAGQVIPDRHQLTVHALPDQPTAAQLQVGLYRRDSLQRLIATDPLGQAVDPPVLARVKVAAAPPAFAPSHALDANLDGRVRLAGCDLPDQPLRPGAEARVTLYWAVLGQLDADYTVFVTCWTSRRRSPARGMGRLWTTGIPPRSGRPART